MGNEIVNIGPFSFNKILFENSTAFTDSIWAVDLDSEIVYVLHDRLTPKRSGTCITLDDAMVIWHDVLVEDERERLLPTLELDYLKHLKKIEQLSARSLVNGEIHTIKQVKSPVFDKDGNTIKVFVSYLDVQELLNTKEELNHDIEIIEALSRDYYNVYVINPIQKSITVEKIDGYVTKGLDGERGEIHPYDEILQNHLRERVHPDDREYILRALSLSNIVAELQKSPEYISYYRTLSRSGKVQHLQFKFIRISEDKIIGAFRNIDKISCQFQTPMSEVQEMVQKALTSLDDRQQLEELLHKISDSTQQLQQLMNRL